MVTGADTQIAAMTLTAVGGDKVKTKASLPVCER